MCCEGEGVVDKAGGNGQKELLLHKKAKVKCILQKKIAAVLPCFV